MLSIDVNQLAHVIEVIRSAVSYESPTSTLVPKIHFMVTSIIAYRSAHCQQLVIYQRVVENGRLTGAQLVRRMRVSICLESLLITFRLQDLLVTPNVIILFGVT